MCTLGADNIEDGAESFMSETEPKELPSVCIKCRNNSPVVVLRSKDAYCNVCFNVSVVHKFKALLGKSKLIRPSDKVLVSYKTGAPSTTLLHLIRDGLNLDTPKRLKFSPVIIFIEDNFDLPIKERQQVLEYVKEHVSSFNFSVHPISLVDYILNDGKNLNFEDTGLINFKECDGENLFKRFKKSISKTMRNDLLKIYEKDLLISAAKHFGCKFVFTTELSSDVAANLLTNVSLGKGSHIPLDTGFCDDRDDSVKILRPLRSFDITEVDFYNTLHSLTPIVVDRPTTNAYASVQDLMVKFVNDLQVNYPATITTIVKTGDKLTLDPVKDPRKCTLCQVNIMRGNTELTSLESTNFSRLISTSQVNHAISRRERYSNTISEFSTKFNDDYCYSCAKIKDFLLD